MHKLKKRPVSFLLDPDLASWYDSLPHNLKSHTINEAIRLYIAEKERGFSGIDLAVLDNHLKETSERLEEHEGNTRLQTQCILNLADRIEQIEMTLERQREESTST